MINRFFEIKTKMLKYAESDRDIKAIIAIGSSTRKDVKSDEYSDLDLLIVTTQAGKWFSGEYPSLFGHVSISFIEPTLGGAKERRSIYDDDIDVDMIIFTPEQFETALKHGVAGEVMGRGFEILYDTQHYSDLIKQYVKPSVSNPDMTEDEFINMVNDFYFHNIWACKKLLRGELWSAKMSTDAYHKIYLLKMTELYCHKINGVDVWHDGRFIDQWADPFILEALPSCFAHYDKKDVKNALVHTHKLFAKITKAIAEKMGFDYPQEAEACAARYLNSHSL